MKVRPVRKTSASGECFEQLATEVLRGSLAPGSPLPAERSLSEAFGVNRQAIREALQRLAQAGLVKISQGEPTRALDYRTHGTLDLLPRLLVTRDGSPAPEVIRSVMEMRARIGTDAARLAAERSTRDHLRRLAVYRDSAHPGTDVAELARLDLQLWEAIVDASDNIAYRLSFNSLRDTYEPLSEVVAPVIQEEIADIEGHVRLIDAIEKRDPAGAEREAHRLLSAGAAAVAIFMSEFKENDDE